MITPLLTGIVLAAGRSRRAGRFKPLAATDAGPLVRRAASGLRERCSEVLVVTGHRAMEIDRALAGLDGVRTVPGPDPDGPMFGSVRAGLAAAGDADGYVLLPVDCLAVDAALLDALIAAWRADGGTRAAVPEHAGRGGHPVLLPAAVRAAAAAAPPHASLRHVIADLGALRVPVDDPDVLTDLDQPEDFRRLGD